MCGFGLSKLESGHLRFLVLGTGAGVLPMFLATLFSKTLESVETVDISETMLKVMCF